MKCTPKVVHKTFGVHFSIQQMLNSHLFYNKLQIFCFFCFFCSSDTFVSLMSR